MTLPLAMRERVRDVIPIPPKKAGHGNGPLEEEDQEAVMTTRDRNQVTHQHESEKVPRPLIER